MTIGKNSLVNLLGATMPILIAIVTVPLYLKCIGTERYGVLAVIWSLLGYFGFIDLGFGRAVAQRLAKLVDSTEAERSSLLWTGLVSTFFLGLVGSALLWISADFILSHLVGMSSPSQVEASHSIFWLLLFLPIVLPASVLQGALQARLRFLELNVIQVLGSALSMLMPLSVGLTGRVGLEYLVPAALGSRLVALGLLLKCCRAHVPLLKWSGLDWFHLRSMVRYGGWVSVISVLAPLLVTVDRLMIAALSGAKSVAQYAVPFDFVTKSMVLSGSVSTAIFPRLAAADEQEAHNLTMRATAVLRALMTPIVVVGILVAQPLLTIWLGHTFAEKSEGVSEVILLGVWANTLVIPLQSRLLAAGDPKVVAVVYLIQVPIYLLIMWWGLVNFGILGAAVAWSARVLMDDVMLLYVGRTLGKTVKEAVPSLLIVIATAFVALTTNWINASRWIFGSALLGLSFMMDRRHLASAIQGLRGKPWCTHQ